MPRIAPWYLTWGIIYEFLRVASHPSVCRTPLSGRDAWAFVQAVLAAPSVRMLVETEHHGRVVSEVFAELPDIKGNLVFDAHTAVLMREHGLKTIYTRDTDFNRFAFLDVVDPIKESTGQPAPADAAAPGRQPSTVCPVAAPARTCYS